LQSMKIVSIVLLSFTLFVCNKNDFFKAPDELIPYVDRSLENEEAGSFSILILLKITK